MKLDEIAIKGNLDREAFAAAEGPLRTELLDLQQRLFAADFGLIVVIEGDDRMGVNELLGRINQWLDPRSLAVNVYDRPGDQARDRPFFWRYWRDLPERGRIGIYMDAWATRCAAARLRGEIGPRHLDRRLADARDFEAQLVDEGYVLVKFWLHLDKKESRRKLEAARKEAEAYWRLEDEDRQILENYGKAMRVAERVLDQTTAAEPWLVLDSSDAQFRDLFVGRTIRDRLRTALERGAPVASPRPDARPVGRGLLRDLDLSASLDGDDYDDRKDRARRRLARRVEQMRRKGRSLVLAFEGPDAAGKGGSIRRVAGALDARDYRVHGIAKPSDEEAARHYLWRFWRRLPGTGKVAIFDRSWYGRLLVERVEGFATEAAWRRAYDEIPSFERQLVEHGSILLKFWLQIDQDEQLRRFEAREETPWKRHKIGDEDYRNRRRWDDYQIAAEEMFAATDRREAPWFVLPANDKRLARILVLETIERELAARLRRR
ncbi:MAG: polyphosphate:AMP phosphotransferase [Planctomycetes bacterium]|nr:polyphosphate:AMP phosphotransferase [Planctomycetota bacterium]